jgi:hypothetical protein
LFRLVLRFFGISSPAVLLMALLSYFGIRMPVPDGPADSPEVIAQRAKKIIETAATAKTKLQETLSKFGNRDDEDALSRPASKRGEDENELANVTYQELFDDAPARPAAAPPKRFSPSPMDRTPRVSDNKKPRDPKFPELNPNPYR